MSGQMGQTHGEHFVISVKNEGIVNIANSLR